MHFPRILDSRGGRETERVQESNRRDLPAHGQDNQLQKSRLQRERSVSGNVGRNGYLSHHRLGLAGFRYYFVGPPDVQAHVLSSSKIRNRRFVEDC